MGMFQGFFPGYYCRLVEDGAGGMRLTIKQNKRSWDERTIRARVCVYEGEVETQIFHVFDSSDIVTIILFSLHHLSFTALLTPFPPHFALAGDNSSSNSNNIPSSSLSATLFKNCSYSCLLLLLPFLQRNSLFSLDALKVRFSLFEVCMCSAGPFS